MTVEDEEQDYTNVTNDRTDSKVFTDKKETAECSQFQPEEEEEKMIPAQSEDKEMDKENVEPLILTKSSKNRIKNKLS